MGVNQGVQGVEGVGAGCDEEQSSHLSRMAAGVLKAIETRDVEICAELAYFLAINLIPGFSHGSLAPRLKQKRPVRGRSAS